jgi:hypothetical protein
MPAVNTIEIAVFAGALLVFSVIPALLTFATNLRRRSAQPVGISLAPVTRPVVQTPAAGNDIPAVAPATEAMEKTPEETEAAPGPPQEERAVSVEERAEEGEHSFCLDDLRHARALETPDREALADPQRQQAWEEGIRLGEAHGSEIGRMTLSASFQPQAHAFHDMHRSGEICELRFLLFPTLWPTAAEQATAEAVFEIGAAGVTAARVVRRASA